MTATRPQTTIHPSWCDTDRCEGDGFHQGRRPRGKRAAAVPHRTPLEDGAFEDTIMIDDGSGPLFLSADEARDLIAQIHKAVEAIEGVRS